jgi:flagella basal body P-ring formation protein FlgA
VVATPPDPRLRLPACGPAPAARVVPGSGLARVTVEVSCRAPAAWRVYLPVAVTATRPVVVAARSLARDTILAPGDVRLAERDVAGLPYGSFASDAEVAGQRLRRELAAGAVLSPGLLLAPALVRRGQAVLMEARAPGFSVRMAGVARRDGRLGDTIPVQNISSGEVREAVVRSAKSVEVLLR